ncbi:hypothetical protein [Streptomyces sp. NPDC004435]|uniref:hypothetical protein n=1 Tax=Streptomyces sp. NPDC004435 TaxID=3364701 RepID=UPI0036999328
MTTTAWSGGSARLVLELASELHAVVVSRLLGIHQNTADAWQRLAGLDLTCAAEITHRQESTATPARNAPARPQTAGLATGTQVQVYRRRCSHLRGHDDGSEGDE